MKEDHITGGFHANEAEIKQEMSAVCCCITQNRQLK